MQQKTTILKPLLLNTLLLLGLYMVCRTAFLLENLSMFDGLTASELWGIFLGGLRFDLAALAYTNALYLLLVSFPLHKKERAGWETTCKVVFVVINWLCLVSNLADAVYYPFIKRRVTASVFTEFANDSLGGIFVIELWRHWYFTLLGLALLAALWWGYRRPHFETARRRRYYIVTTCTLLLSAAAVFLGQRGHIDVRERPIHNGIAREHVQQPRNAALVLNTPFSILRTMGKKPYPTLSYYATEAELAAVFNPVRSLGQQAGLTDGSNPSTNAERPDNIVILLLESFSAEYSHRLNPGTVGYMPFLDSLMAEGLTYDISMANGVSSIDAQASVFASIPMMIESFISSNATMNELEGMGTYLKRMGYSTAYFHGADNGSLSIDGFVRSCGFDSYHGRNEYGNDADWDHHWGIWDEPFLLYFSRQLSLMHEPFCAGLFTLTSHHPFRIPGQYEAVCGEGTLPIHRTIRYTDISLRHFFEAASKQPWYDHTLFVITGDHTNMQETALFRSDMGMFRVPLFFYHPTDSTFRGHRRGVVQHIDILPTVLHHAGYQGRYFAFGRDLLADSLQSSDELQPNGWDISYLNGQYQLTTDSLFLQFDGQQPTALYDYHHDPLLQANLVATPSQSRQRDLLVRQLKAIIQQYMTRMNENKLKADK